LISSQTEYFVLNKAFTRHSKTGQCHFNSSWNEASPTLRLVLTVLMSVYFWSKGKEYIYIDKRPRSKENPSQQEWLMGSRRRCFLLGFTILNTILSTWLFYRLLYINYVWIKKKLKLIFKNTNNVADSSSKFSSSPSLSSLFRFNCLCLTFKK
jgi:membrane glycosyltransferase